jgi:hypothetical protein
MKAGGAASSPFFGSVIFFPAIALLVLKMSDRVLGKLAHRS